MFLAVCVFLLAPEILCVTAFAIGYYICKRRVTKFVKVLTSKYGDTDLVKRRYILEMLDFQLNSNYKATYL